MPSFSSKDIFHSTALNSEPLFHGKSNSPIQTSKQILSQLRNMVSDSSQNTIILPTPSIISPTPLPPTAIKPHHDEKITSAVSSQHLVIMSTLTPLQPSIIEKTKAPAPPPELIDISSQAVQQAPANNTPMIVTSSSTCEPLRSTRADHRPC